MRIRAAVIEEKSGPFVHREVELGSPRPDELLVRIVAAGICQTDLHARDQHYPVPLPLVAGHEGAGIVLEVGSSVEGFEVGDHVVLSYPSCGKCDCCRSAHPPYCEEGIPLCFGGARPDGSQALKWTEENPGPGELHGHFFAQSSFATHAITHLSNTVKVPRDLPLELLAPLGCGLQTGAGAVVNALKVRPGSSIAIFGTGTVGLAAVMAAKIAGASPIIAVDINPERLELARGLGATHTINPLEESVAHWVARLTRTGVDYALEITARPEMLSLALEILAPLGVAALIGGAPAGVEASLDMTTLLNGRTVRGIIEGDAVPQIFIPWMLEMHKQGRFPFDRLVRFYDFEEINQAVEDVCSGRTVKAVLRMGKA